MVDRSVSTGLEHDVNPDLSADYVARFLVTKDPDRGGWVVEEDKFSGTVFTRHATLQQAVDSAKKRAAPVRGTVVWWDDGGRKEVTYGSR